MSESKDQLREKLAAVQHEIWSSWMAYLFSCCSKKINPVSDFEASYPGASLGPIAEMVRKDARLVIPTNKVERWKRQIETPYHELSEEEKESDRHQADKVLAVLSNSVKEITYEIALKTIGLWATTTDEGRAAAQLLAIFDSCGVNHLLPEKEKK